MKPLRPLVLTTLALALAGCGLSTRELPAQETATAQQPDRVQTIRIGADAARSTYEATPGVTVLAWQPDAGFAILERSGASAGAPALSALGLGSSEPSASRYTLPETQASGLRAGSRGLWSGGNGGWTKGPGALRASPRNGRGWEQIDLADARLLASRLGKGVKVAVIDTGVDLKHPALEGHLSPASEWKDYVDGDAVPQEMDSSAGAYGHGTGVAGIILQVAPEATILPIRVLRPDGSGDLSALVQAIGWAIDRGADVINLSLGSDTTSAALSNMLGLATTRGVFTVASSGNTGGQNVTYPAADTALKAAGTYLISVGSVDGSDSLSSFSNYGKALDLLAPGENVVTAAPDSQIAAWSGTSFAAPQVTGALALALGQGFSPAQLQKKLLEGADNVEKATARNASFKSLLGQGRLNLGTFLGKLK
ncbi:S8 family peptidase [Deinococcus koreensis]|uniref:Peptidase S8/S53 subtilisin kexin sedolisin n=1 Tax=Deinococcus koreensis TaxID=2054903 RepID=A0A2K3UWI7_9DEIO|nr:S8 family serine peptidase [Deinococcus koreensis]PNY80902.1 peptidase S8/S53 subtilisin kexin sedolisin [Deinococcus koreensis]